MNQQTRKKSINQKITLQITKTNLRSHVRKNHHMKSISFCLVTRKMSMPVIMALRKTAVKISMVIGIRQMVRWEIPNCQRPQKTKIYSKIAYSSNLSWIKANKCLRNTTRMIYTSETNHKQAELFYLTKVNKTKTIFSPNRANPQH